jgi:hypothetical protein
MAVQASLLNAQIPMSAAQGNPVGSYVKGVESRGEINRINAEEELRNRTKADQDAVGEYLKQGGELYTPTGVAKAVVDMKGKVSSDAYLKLVGHAQQVAKQDLATRKDLLDLDEQGLKLRGTQMEKLITYLDQPLQVYGAVAKEKGEAEATAQFEPARAQIVANAAKEMGPNGQPLFPPQVIEQMSKATPQQLKGMLASTSYHKNLVQERFVESQIKRNEGLAEWDTMRAKILEKNGGTLSVGTMSEIAKVDNDVKNGVISKEQGKAMIDGIVAKKSKPSDVSGLSPEAIEDAATNKYLYDKLPARITPVERTMILNRAAEKAREAGDTAEEASLRAVANKSGQSALSTLNRQMQMTSVFERDADKRLTLVQELAIKADTSGIPALNRWINAGRKNILGDVDVNNLNSAVISLQAELAKVLSGSLGNAAVSDSARAEAAQIINANMSLEQINSLIPVIRKELGFKLDSFKEQRQAVMDEMKIPTGKAPLPGSRSAAPLAESTQAERDKDQARILTSEHTKARDELSKLPAGEARTRKEADIASLEREMKAAKVPISGATPAPTAAPIASPAPTPAAPRKQPPAVNAKGWVLHKDAKGNMAYVGPNREIEEVK